MIKKLLTQPGRIPARISKAIAVRRLVLNRRELYTSMRERTPLCRLDLVNGWFIHAPEDAQLWNHFNDIWLNRGYTSDRFDLAEGDVVVDVGANVGLFSLLAAQTAERIICFEPSPRNVVYLRRNLDENGIQNVTAVQAAVSSEDGTVQFSVSARSPTADSMFIEGKEEAEGEVFTVEALSLSTIMERYALEHIDFFKMDCEGAEFDILLNASDELLQKIRRMVLEYHDHLTEHRHGELVERLVRAGFEVDITRQSQTCGIMRAFRKAR